MAKKTKKQQVVPQFTVPQGQLCKSLGDIAESAYLRFGDYANNHRQLPDVRDGYQYSYHAR